MFVMIILALYRVYVMVELHQMANLCISGGKMIKEPMTNLIIRIPEQLKRMLESCAIEQDLTSSQIVRKLIRDYVKDNYSGDLFAIEKPKQKDKSR